MNQINITIRNKKDLIKILEEIQERADKQSEMLIGYIVFDSSISTLISALKNTK